MITYNHEAFIAQAIEGVLMQKTNFPVELVIGEDCSTDGTREIINVYAHKYPDQIRTRLNEKNLGAHANFITTLIACHGKYIALCEGDDYWTDPLKLQKQVDFLEYHLECAICFHPALILNTNDQTLDLQQSYYSKCISNIEDLLLHNYIQTCTAMFRNGLISKFPDWFHKTVFGDWTLHILNSQHGKIGFINENMAIYRSHPGGIWTSRSNLDKCKTMVDFYILLKYYFGRQYSSIINHGLSREYIYLSSIYLDQGNIADAKTYLKKSINSYILPKDIYIDQLVILGRLYFPGLYRFLKWILRK